MASDFIDIQRNGEPAIAARSFAWGMLAFLFAFLVNNALVVGYDMPGVKPIFSGSASSGSWFQLGIYVAAILGAILFVRSTRTTALRWDAMNIHRFNLYLIRAMFWIVLLVGIVDSAIAFMRVEGILVSTLGAETSKLFGKARWVGPYIHMPLVFVGFVLAAFTRTLGFTWLALMIVAAELAIVISRFVFSYEQALDGRSCPVLVCGSLPLCLGVYAV